MTEFNPKLSSSCSSFICERACKYDIFLSFRGEDTRRGFTGNLYHALKRKGIRTFIDESLERGEKITPALSKTIQESRIAIIIFSIDYASSTFCLDELVKILECKEQKDLFVLPIFYLVDPSDVRNQGGNYGRSLARLEAKFNDTPEKIEKWKSALRKAANITGRHFEGYMYEFEFIEKIVADVLKRIRCKSLHVADYPVGLKSKAQEVITLLKAESNARVVMVGIHGIGGIGKTTIACEVYNAIAYQFDGACFLSDIRVKSEHGLVRLQESLLEKITGEKERVDNINEGIPIIRERLHNKKVLLILDDVDSAEQLKALAGGFDWFCSGSKIIIITRDEHLLDVNNVKIKYEVAKLCHGDALKLFIWNAFKKTEVDARYAGLSDRVVNYCDGLPLALEVIGSNLFGKTPSEWNSALDMYERTPEQRVQKILSVSYYGLNETEKMIFLDIACFFGGWGLPVVTCVLSNGRDIDPQYVIGVLKKKSLLRIDGDVVTMHHLIQDMGREIVRRQSSYNLAYCSRLWCYKDVLRVLQENLGTDKIEALVLQLPKDKEVRWDGKGLKKMKNLQILIIRNTPFSCEPKHLPNSLRVLIWEEYPSSIFLPSNFQPKNLCIVYMCRSCIRSVKSLKNFESLKEIALSSSPYLEQVQDVSGASNLEKLYIDGCTKLTKVDDSVGQLNKLRLLNADGCTKLSIFPQAIHSTSFEFLNLTNCIRLQCFPKMSGIGKTISYVKFFNFGEKLEDWELFPSSIVQPLTDDNLGNEKFLDQQTLVLERSMNILSLRCGILMFAKLIKWKDAFQFLAGRVGNDQERVSSLIQIHGFDLDRLKFPSQRFPLFHNMVQLNLAYSVLKILPACIDECRYLDTLILDGCIQLQEIRGIPRTIKKLSAKNCLSLTTESSNMLLSQKLHESGGTNFTIPAKSIPQWFDHCSMGPSMSFWFRNKFPLIALCIIHASFLELHINGILVFNLLDNSPLRDHTFLLDLECTYGWRGRDYIISKKNVWNHVEVSSSHGDSIIGVYIFKQGNNVEDARFTDPNLLNTSNRKTDFNLLESFNSIQAPTILKIIMGKIFQNSLPTYLNLHNKRLVDSAFCPICETKLETMEHVFLYCPWTKPVWFGSDLQWSFDNKWVCDFKGWLYRKLNKIAGAHGNANQVFCLVGSICWAIWKGRSEFVLRGKPVNPREALTTAQTVLEHYSDLTVQMRATPLAAILNQHHNALSSLTS